MSKKHKNSDTINLIRRVLDDPNSPIPKTENKNIYTLRRRLKNQSKNHYSGFTPYESTDTSLTPQIQIHHTENEKRWTD